MDFSNMAVDSLNRMHENGKVQEIVDKHIESTVNDIASDVFGRWSIFNKELKKKVEESINIDVNKLNVQGYNKMVLNVVQEKLEEAITVVGSKQLSEELENLLGTGEPPTLKLSELMNMVKGDEPDEDRWGENASFYCDNEFSTLCFIYMDEEPDKEKYECDIKVTVYPDTGEIKNVRIDGSEFDNRLIMGGLSGVDKELFKLYTMKGTLELDCDHVDTYYEDPTAD